MRRRTDKRGRMTDDTLFDPAEATMTPEPGSSRIRVLVYPNITYARNLEADSYIVAVRSMIRHLLANRDDLHFVMLVPAVVPSLAMEHVEQIVYPLPTYPNTMRAHFDTRDFMAAIDWQRRSYDIVWSHLPEHTLAMRNVFYNATNEKPVFVGYSHWFEVPENTAYAETLLSTNLAGVLAMDRCGVNSRWLRNLILDYANDVVGQRNALRLNDIIEPQYLGVDPPPPAAMVPHERVPGRIVFNHRPNEYTGFNEVVKAFDALWQRRQDFSVGFTLADVDRPWAFDITAPDRARYMTELAIASFGIGRFKRYSAWSMSVMDGLSVGTPYVLPRGLCYPEMVGHDWPWLFDNGRDFLGVVERALDHPEAILESSGAALDVARSFTWERRIVPISAMFDRAIAALPMVADTDAYQRVRALAAGGAPKYRIVKAMGWGVRVPWTQYRTRLRADGVYG